ncbi:MAG: hypothetical protein LRZ84_14700 [Desertifilum sp.]|nr:hypothetical protein [Desertifilum sp.]
MDDIQAFIYSLETYLEVKGFDADVSECLESAKQLQSEILRIEANANAAANAAYTDRYRKSIKEQYEAISNTLRERFSVTLNDKGYFSFTLEC